jgi:cobalt-zinc-cadmium efflux system membrane fusion protein
MKPTLLAAAVCASLMAVSGAALAGPGHDHGDEAQSPAGNGPKRQADGSVFLPKPTQRQLAVRTLAVQMDELPRTVELNGKVVMDPNAGGKVQSTVAGRIVPGPRGLPVLGERVRKGEVLAYVIPSTGAIERANQGAQLAELKAARSVAEKRIARLRELADTVPRKEIEAAEIEAGSLADRIGAVGGSLAGRDALVSPVAGVIASAHVVAGQVVDARELAFEVVDPSRLSIEALAYDTQLAANVAGAALAVGEERVQLRYVGAARVLREQALPMVFRAEASALTSLAVGQPVRVHVHTTAKVKGLRVPAASLMKSASNQTIVWVKTAPERFEPRVVATEPLDGVSVAVTSGLAAGDRVATQGATLINQIR